MGWRRVGVLCPLAVVLATGCGLTMISHPMQTTTTSPVNVDGPSAGFGGGRQTVPPIVIPGVITGADGRPLPTSPDGQPLPTGPDGQPLPPGTTVPGQTTIPVSPTLPGQGQGPSTSSLFPVPAKEPPKVPVTTTTTTTLPDFPIDNNTRLLCTTARAISDIGNRISNEPNISATEFASLNRQIATLVRGLAVVAPPDLARKLQTFVDRNQVRLRLIDLGLVDEYVRSWQQLLANDQADRAELIDVLDTLVVLCPPSFGLAPPPK